MSNVCSYVDKYGFLPFHQMPFGAGDNVALCTVIYMPFEEVVSPDFSAQPMPFADACRQLFEKRGEEHKPLGLFISKNTSVLMMEMCKRKRYTDMRVAACRSCLDAEPSMQFAAMTFLLPTQKLVIVFRGTDDTMEGWAEDIDMINSPDGVPSSKESLSYLQHSAERFPGDIILCGHSKGGYNALYAALHADASIKQRIIAVYNNDGPGFSDDSFLHSDAYKELLGKYHHFIPQSSFFGMMLDHDDDYQIVKSSKPFGALQHDLLTWKFDGNRLMRAKKKTPESRFNHAFFHALKEEVTDDEVAAVDEAARTLMEHADSTRLIDLKNDVAGSLKNTTDAVKSMDKDTKKTIKTVVKKSFAAAKKAIKDKPEN
ncbi:MAG: DUF2974 domain-containing protein [Clostridia bacterium]|nr:DUF2974 domain-containing protein [Clostridia bacterium]